MEIRPFPRTLPPTRIDIFGVNLTHCGEDCGPHLTDEELTESVRAGCSQRFGDKVTVEYHSLRDQATRDQHAQLLENARGFGVPLPLVVIDGAIFQGGGVDFRAIVNALELKTEIGGVE